MRNFLKIALFLLSIILSYFVYRSIMEPVKFNEFKKERYAMGVERLMKIRDAQVVYREVNQKYASSFDSLIPFIDTGKIAIISRKDTTVYETDNRGILVPKDKTIKDTTGIVLVKDSLFKGFDYKNLGVLTINEKKVKIDLDATMEELDSEQLETFTPQPFFRAAIKKRDLLDGASENNILVAINKPGDIDGDALTVGNLNKASTDGNWTKEYEEAINDLDKEK